MQPRRALLGANKSDMGQFQWGEQGEQSDREALVTTLRYSTARRIIIVKHR